MNEHQRKALKFTNKLSAAASLLGFAVMLFSLFVSDIGGKYLLFIGLGVIVSAVFFFIFGLALALAEGASPNGSQSLPHSKKKETSPCH
ncbi:MULTISPECIES: hypothetical protein [unclassified Paenibacillus]|uniref:hypothetical protein n=1 Tax=unclassified Paenibacillus TaxID=185978 RepID=UPI001AE1BEF2|nr:MULTISPECIES: hypothetical protein [unclassified Paenibacillus]MBP1154256.1 hypothetical protein [Paenibacillus sp. PvP091]MBP1170359.1 hypothetical protein [Paenibacillus sp. PvR098]MBP2441387.1 hypothetical protein [Paenibacillus sp. PvP052]